MKSTWIPHSFICTDMSMIEFRFFIWKQHLLLLNRLHLHYFLWEIWTVDFLWPPPIPPGCVIPRLAVSPRPPWASPCNWAKCPMELGSARAMARNTMDGRRPWTPCGRWMAAGQRLEREFVHQEHQETTGNQASQHGGNGFWMDASAELFWFILNIMGWFDGMVYTWCRWEWIISEISI